MSAFANIFKIPELKRRLAWTLALLAVYRVGIFVTTPGVDRNVMRQIVANQGGGTFLGMFNMFSGGALEQLSVFALGIMPYVSASIILQLMSMVVKPLEDLRKEGESGTRKINQYTRYATIALSIIQGFLLARYIEGLNAQSQYGDVVRISGPAFYGLTIVALTTGTAFIMWLGEQITERGIGNGTSMIIFAGIVADLPDAIVKTIEQVKIGRIQPISLMVVSAIVLFVVAIIVFFEGGRRQLPIHTVRRSVSRQGYRDNGAGTMQSFLPLRVNMAGVIPPIFASSLLMFPNTLANLNVPFVDKLQSALNPGDWRYMTVYVLMIVFFAFFYTSIVFQPVDIAESLKKQNSFIPGVRPGKSTADHIDHILQRITFGGAVYMAFVCSIPTLLMNQFHVPFFFGGTGIMIVVGVALDTVQQIESHLITRHYEGILGPGGPRITGRRA